MIPRKIQLTGKVYIKYLDEITTPSLGDVMLLLNDDAKAVTVGDYTNIKTKGYIKAKLYDGRVWQNIDIAEFCSAREHKFTKKQYAIDSAKLCLEIMASYAGVIVEKTYRGHFTRT